MFNALVGAAVLILLCLLGAAAFNPDEGFLLASGPLWQIFGIGAYIGSLAFPLIALAALLKAAASHCRVSRVRGR